MKYVDYRGFKPLRISHETQLIEQVPDKEQIQHEPVEKTEELVLHEVKQRKKIMAGLAKEIQQLEELLR